MCEAVRYVAAIKRSIRRGRSSVPIHDRYSYDCNAIFSRLNGQSCCCLFRGTISCIMSLRHDILGVRDQRPFLKFDFDYLGPIACQKWMQTSLIGTDCQLFSSVDRWTFSQHILQMTKFWSHSSLRLMNQISFVKAVLVNVFLPGSSHNHDSVESIDSSNMVVSFHLGEPFSTETMIMWECGY